MAGDQRRWRHFLLSLAGFLFAVLGFTSNALWTLRAEAVAGSFQVAALMARSFESSFTQSLNATGQAATQLQAQAGGGENRVADWR